MPSTPPHADAVPPMTPERWRAVDAALQAALACEPERRDAVVAEACGDDAALRREVESLLALHDGAAADDFLERPAIEALGEPRLGPLADRLARALAGRYAIEREIAHGGMATVFLARDLRHDRRVALKVLRESLAAAVGAERFLAEIRVTASLQHPHILPLFDSGDADGLLWYAMPFVEGETLRARLSREKRLPVDEAVRLAREIAVALDYAHARGVIHRDVKPENVLLQGGAAGAHAVVADFGIALALEQAGGERLTRTGLTLGTPQYMAPEQAAGERALDARVDVYALGAVLHEMLAGESPAASPKAALQRVLREPPPALAPRRPDVAPSLDAAVRRALARRPEDRFASAREFADALDEPQVRVAQAAPTPTPAPARAPGRTVPARAAVYAALAALGVGLAGGWMLARSTLAERAAARLAEGWSAERPEPRPSEAPNDLPAEGWNGEGTLVVVDRAGRPRRTIDARRPWTPRFSPDGRSVAYGAFGPGRNSSDIWVVDLGAGTTRRLTDDDRDANDPQWSPDGAEIAYSAGASGGKDLLARPAAGGEARVLAARPGTQFASDWLRDGSALLVTEEGPGGRDVRVQPADGSPSRPYAATQAGEGAARVSPDGRWVAYTSDESGRAEVYLDAYPRSRRRVRVSPDGGAHPVWRGDGRELYYWRDGALVAVRLAPAAGDAPPTLGAESVLFRAPYSAGPNTMYDVSPDGQRFVLVRRP